jgi:O-antigen ligase
MLVGLVASQSRAGMAGLLAALGLGAYLRRRKGAAVTSGWIAAAIAAAVLVVLSRVDVPGLLARVSGAGIAVSRRMEIWQATLPVVRDFWLAGTGAGTYETAMLVYRRAPSLFRINAAHNHYLQMLTEGGVVMAVPIVIAAASFVSASVAALERDRSGMYLLRAGALCGLAGAAVQSIWETGWLTPANAILAAVLAAIVIHHPPHRHSRPAA